MAVHEKPLWVRAYHGPWGRKYLNAGKIVGYLGVDAKAFDEAARKLDGYDRNHYECVLHEITVYADRQKGRYVLTTHAKKVFRLILGEPPGSPTYESWWRARLVSVKADRERGLKVEWADVPPVPLEPVVPEAKEKEKPAKKVKAAPAKKAKKG